MRKILLTIAIGACALMAHAQNFINQCDTTARNIWVEEQMAHMTPEQRLGQLIMPMYIMEQATPANLQSVRNAVSKYNLGGVLFSKGTIASQCRLVNAAQEASAAAGIPGLMVAIDGEWGVNMRLRDAIKFPRNGALGKINSQVRDSLLYIYGREVARQCREVGVHVNFAPVMDVNSNPKNPVIGNRAFGSDARMVAECGISYARGLEDGGVLSVTKHFPGHGDTSTDSHVALPVVRHKRERLDKVELVPFQSYIDAGLGGVMSAHLDVRAMSSKRGMPATANSRIITDLLRHEMGFNGLVFTDGLAMAGAQRYKDICIEALKAGCDILVQPTPLDAEWRKLVAALKDGRLPQDVVDAHCRRVLKYKYAMGLHTTVPQVSATTETVNTPYAERLLAELTRLSGNPKTSDFDPTLAFEMQNTSRIMEEATVPEASPSDTTASWPLYVPNISLPLSTPEAQGFNKRLTKDIDDIASEILRVKAAPSFQILVARHGQVVYSKQYGVADDGIDMQSKVYYDLASMSKGLATVPAIALLVDQGKLTYKDKAAKYLPELKGTRYRNITIEMLMFHETGMRAGYNFFDLCSEQELRQNPEMARDLREHKFIDIIANLTSKKPVGTYRYSCLNFVLLRYIIERVSKMRLDEFLNQHLPQYFGSNTCFNPLEHGIPLRQIAPTEVDDIVRHRKIHGTVHDEIGAWAGGIEGNSGLFGNAEALAPLIQLLMDDNRFHEVTTRKSTRSRRGLGFDKPEMGNKKLSPCAKECSAKTWGHTGFTGTCFWVDPKYDMMYIFLSNRTYPSRKNTKLSKLDFREKIQSAIYKNIVK